MLPLQTVGVKGFPIELDLLLLEGCLDYPLSISEAQAVCKNTSAIHYLGFNTQVLRSNCISLSLDSKKQGLLWDLDRASVGPHWFSRATARVSSAEELLFEVEVQELGFPLWDLILGQSRKFRTQGGTFPVRGLIGRELKPGESLFSDRDHFPEVKIAKQE